ncbi:HD-GYP domain-containing protein [Pseudobutyrivibrio ruminis]|uniref:HD-GYP domain-containing protein n=1 Tax=Pseudobutyrivibrio ruminis TaxID=46206 RepID=UPI0006883B0E|nr:HD domain-containing phosphohydrolase [Pseudobutyrivibrio ruminis]
MLEVLQIYWPKFITAAWFPILNLILVWYYKQEKLYLFERILSGFFVSPSFVAIIGQELCIYIYKFILSCGFNDKHYTFFIIFNIAMDALTIIIGGMLFSRLTQLNKFLGATIYMQYVCIERLAMVISISYFSYIAWYLLLQFIVGFFTIKDMPYMFNSESIKWKNIFFYLVGLFYVLDMLYGAFFLFPELANDVINIGTIFWLDTLAFINSAFVLGYQKVAISVAHEYDTNIKYYERLQSGQENIIIRLTEISEAKSGETGQHVRRVAEYSKLLASTMGMNTSDIENIKIAAMMHDLGKLLISHDIIEKTDKLTEEEYEIMKQHAKYGWDILSNSEGEIIAMARVIALEHHERWDGQGYPQGLRGDDISIYAQIVSVADVFDALSSERAYKPAWDLEKSKNEIIKQRGEQFSPAVVDAFIKCFDGIKAIHEQYED